MLGEKPFEVQVHDDGAPGVRTGIGQDAVARQETMSGRLGAELGHDLFEDPALGRGHCAMWRAQGPLAAVFLGHFEMNIMDPRGDLGVEGQPSQARDREIECPGQFNRRAHHGQPGALEVRDAASSFAEPARDPAAEEHDVVGLPPATASARRCFRSAASAFFRALIRARSCFWACTARLAGHRRLVLDRGLGRPHAVHLGPNSVDLDQVLRVRSVPVDHRTIDELRPRIVGRRDQVAASEPGV